MTPEGLVKAVVKKVLAKHAAYWHCPVQNGMGAPSLDFIGCHKSRFFSIETKAGKGQATPRQVQTAISMRSAGGRVFLINEETGTAELERWLDEQVARNQ